MPIIREIFEFKTVQKEDENVISSGSASFLRQSANTSVILASVDPKSSCAGANIPGSINNVETPGYIKKDQPRADDRQAPASLHFEGTQIFSEDVENINVIDGNTAQSWEGSQVFEGVMINTNLRDTESDSNEANESSKLHGPASNRSSRPTQMFNGDQIFLGPMVNTNESGSGAGQSFVGAQEFHAPVVNTNIRNLNSNTMRTGAANSRTWADLMTGWKASSRESNARTNVLSNVVEDGKRHYGSYNSHGYMKRS